MVQTQKKIALLHRHPKDRIRETNAAFPYLVEKGIDVLTFKSFNRLGKWGKLFKSFLWIFYAPLLVVGKKYDVIYCDDSFPFYPLFVKIASPFSEVVIRLGDFHLMYYTSGIFYRLLHVFEKWGWYSADKIIVISQVMADKLYEEGFSSIVIRDPVDTEHFFYKEENSGFVMFHGTLTRNKNVDVLLHAARWMPDTEFRIIGDGPDRKRLEMIAPDNVAFRGWVSYDEIPYHLSECAVGVALRSDNPGNDYVLTSPFIQYGAMGKPCLVTRRKAFGAYPWQFESSKELIGKIRKLLNASPEEGKKVRGYIVYHHDAKKIAEEIWSKLNQ